MIDKIAGGGAGKLNETKHSTDPSSQKRGYTEEASVSAKRTERSWCLMITRNETPRFLENGEIQTPLGGGAKQSEARGVENTTDSDWML